MNLINKIVFISLLLISSSIYANTNPQEQLAWVSKVNELANNCLNESYPLTDSCINFRLLIDEEPENFMDVESLMENGCTSKQLLQIRTLTDKLYETLAKILIKFTKYNYSTVSI